MTVELKNRGNVTFKTSQRLSGYLYGKIIQMTTKKHHMQQEMNFTLEKEELLLKHYHPQYWIQVLVETK